MTGIILAGGGNTRMGQNKAFLRVGGERLIDRTVRLFRSLFGRSSSSPRTRSTISTRMPPLSPTSSPAGAPSAGSTPAFSTRPTNTPLSRPATSPF